MKYCIEIELPDNEVISEDIKVTPITWYYHGCGGQSKAKPVKHGYWVLDPDGMDWNIPAWRCSVCACRNDNLPVMKGVTPKTIMRFSGSKYCPNCGAKMDEEVKKDGH